MVRRSRSLVGTNVRRPVPFISLPNIFRRSLITNDLQNHASLSLPDSKDHTKCDLLKSITNLMLSDDNDRKTVLANVQLYKPIYVARRSHNSGNISYDEGDEFELIDIIEGEYLSVVHLRTNTEYITHRHSLRLDSDTPLRLGSDNRNVVQRCLWQYNVAGAYLIRRSNTASDAFVLSVAHITEQTDVSNWHHLIRVDSKTNCFYFTQEQKLKHLFFRSFNELVRDPSVRESLSLSVPISFRIEFDQDIWHIPRYQLIFDYCIGKGEFGEVWRALWRNGDRLLPVAVKRLRQLQHKQTRIDGFIREIETMKTLSNNYIVALYGISNDPKAEQSLLVTELMEKGDLKKWLKCRETLPDEAVIVSFARDICRGMSFLEQISRVHRDLACRNLLINATENVIKIADFGLSGLANVDNFEQNESSYSSKLPIRWTAPEVLKNQKVYCTKSDVWSFGIVLIEIWLKGNDPYPDENDLTSIQSLITKGHVHAKPLPCTDVFYDRLILPCLKYSSRERPSFKSLLTILKQWNKEEC